MTSERARSTLFWFLVDVPWLARLANQLDVLRRGLREGAELRRAGLFLRLLLRFSVGTVA